MKRFLQEVVWRLSLVAALLTCTALAAWGQEETPEKVMYPVYTNIQGNKTINAPSEIAEGETLYFTVGGVSGGSLGAYNGGESCGLELDDNSQYYIPNIKGPVLLHAEEGRTYTTADGVTYSGPMNSFEIIDRRATQPSSSSVELKNRVQIDGVNYWVQNYNGCFNEYESVTSITFPNTVMYFGANSIDKQTGLKEIHAKAIDPSHYNYIKEAFGTKDLSGVTLYVPQGYLDAYKQSVFGSLFTTIVEEDEASPTEFNVYPIGAGIKDYTPKTAVKGQDLSVKFSLESGYYSPYSSSYGQLGEYVDCDQPLFLRTTNKIYTQNGMTFALWDFEAIAYLFEVEVPSGVEELVIPEYLTTDDGNTYIVRVENEVSGNLEQVKKMTIEGNTSMGVGAFDGCTALEEIHCKSEIPSTINSAASAFDYSIWSTCVVYVPEGSVEAYKNSLWEHFDTIVEEGTQPVLMSVIVNSFDSVYLQVNGEGSVGISYRVEEGAEADVLLRYTIQDYDQWKDHVKIYSELNMSDSEIYNNPVKVSADGVFEIPVSKDLLSNPGGYNWFTHYLLISSDQPGELVYDIQAYWSESGELAMELKENTMIFINPVSFTCDKDTVKGSVGEVIQIPITVGEVPSDIVGKELSVTSMIFMPPSAEGNFHLYRPDGKEVELKYIGSMNDAATGEVSLIVLQDEAGIVLGEFVSNQTYILTLVSDIEIPSSVQCFISFKPIVDDKAIDSADWSVWIEVNPSKVIEDDETVTDTEVDKITIESKQETQITVNLDGVTSGEVTVSTESDVKLELSGDNDLGDLVNSGNLVISTTTTTNVTLNYNTITNEGTLTDETGLVTSVEGSAALSIEPIADATVQEGGTVTLTATATVEVNVTVTFQWQRLVDGVWQNVGEPIVQGGTITRAASDANGITANLEVQSADAGEYRCLISRTEPVESTDDKEVSTTLTAYATVTVSEPVEPEPEPDPEPSYYDVTLPVVEGATVEAVGSTSVEAGDSFSFTITVKEGYVATNMVVKANGVTLTPNADGRYTIANVRSNVVVTVTGIEEDPATAVESVDASDLKVWAADGRLFIQTPRADRAYIVTFGGRVYKIHELPAGETAIPMPQGAYIIYVGGESFKISM